MRILCFGELLFDHIEDAYYLGGASTNFAGHSARLGAESYLISAVGNDELGDRGIEGIRSYGIKDDYVVRNSHKTGTVEVALENGIPSYDIAFSAWDYIELDETIMDQLKAQKFDLFYFGSLAQRTPSNAELVHRLLRQLSYKDTFFDVNLRQEFFSKEILADSLNYTTIMKLNDEELPIISHMLFNQELAPESFLASLKRQYPVRIMLLTCGKDGTYFFSDQGDGHIVPEDVPVVDTVGAGDSFSAGFMRAYESTKDVKESVKFATVLANYVVSRQGALPEYDAALMRRLSLIPNCSMSG